MRVLELEMTGEDMGQELLEMEPMVAEDLDGEVVEEGYKEDGSVAGDDVDRVENIEDIDVGGEDDLMVTVVNSWGNLLTEQVNSVNNDEEEKECGEAEVVQEGMDTFVCPVCGKSFRTRKQLGDHVRYHHKDPTNCNLCNKTFPSKRQAQSHMRNVHTISSYMCPECGSCSTILAIWRDTRRMSMVQRHTKLQNVCLCSKKFLNTKQLTQQSRGNIKY